MKFKHLSITIAALFAAGTVAAATPPKLAIVYDAGG